MDSQARLILAPLLEIHTDAMADPEAREALVSLGVVLGKLWPHYVKAVSVGRIMRLASNIALAWVKK